MKLGRFWAAQIAALLVVASAASAQTIQTNYFRQIADGPNVFAYFEGRSPCQGIVQLWSVPDKEACIKIKWQLVLYKDPVTQAPTTYALGGLLWRNPPKTGKWTMVKGTKEDPEAVVYRLESEDGKELVSFQKADEKILLFLDEKRELLVGNEDFSYTLNRAALPGIRK